MRKITLVALCLAVAASAMAQPTSYDPYYVLPGEAGSKSVDVGLTAGDVGSIGDVGMIPIAAKYGLSDQIELGARLDLGLLNDNADDLSTIVVGAKYGLGEDVAVTANLLVPTGDADDPGLAIGAMKTITSGDLMINNSISLALLDGYTGGTGIGVSALIEPNKAFGDALTGYLDIIINTNTDDIAGDPLGINLAPNVDYMLNDSMVINGGVTIGIAGDGKADDIGLTVFLLKAL